MKYLTLSFDDGTIQDRRFVPILNKYGLKATFNINSGLFGQKHDIVQEGITINHSEIEADEVKELYKGHEVSAHTLTHPWLPNCTDSEVIREVGDDAKNLEKLCGYKIVGLAYPGGPGYNDDIIKLIKDNTDIIYARSTGSHFTFDFPDNLMTWHPTCQLHPIEYKELEQLTDEFVNYKGSEDKLFYLWGHSFEFDKFGIWDEAEKFLQKLSGHKDICYVTNREIAQMLVERNKK